MLYEKLQEDIKKAMIARDDVKRNCLRGLLSDVKNKTVNEGKPITDDAVAACAAKAVKMRREAIEQFENAGRAELAEREKAELEFIFDPSGARSFTYRTVDLYDKSGNHLATLSIRAEVIPMDTSPAATYPVIAGAGLRTDRYSVNMGYCRFGQRTLRSIPIVNEGERIIRLEVWSSGDYLKLNCPSGLDPGEESSIELECELPAEGECTSLVDTLYFKVDGKELEFRIPVERIFLPLIPESADVPAMQSYPSVGRLVETRTQRRSRKLEYLGEMEIRNAGTAPLKIIHVISSGDCSLKKGQSLAPGAGLKVKLRTEKSEDRVEIFTNDPSRPYKELIFKYL